MLLSQLVVFSVVWEAHQLVVLSLTQPLPRPAHLLQHKARVVGASSTPEALPSEALPETSPLST